MSNSMLSVLIASGVALVAGCVLGWLSQRGRTAELANEARRLQAEAMNAREAASAARATADAERESRERLQAERERLSREKDEAETLATKAQTELTGERERTARLIADREALANQFEVLAAKILKEQSSTLTDQNQANIGRMLEPLKTGLEQMVEKTQHLETKREGAYVEVLNEIKHVKETHERLRVETSQLVTALRAPKVRGNWGELQLRRCIEFAGMVEYASFDLEVTVSDGESSLRPDCVIHLPNRRTMVIDAKTPFDSFLEAMQTAEEPSRSNKLKAHAARVRRHLDDLSSKAYWKQFRNSTEGNSPEFVVCFLSSEVLFSAALEQDPSLIEHGANSQVILATPTTLIALLKAVAYGWQQMEITREAAAICEAGEALYGKLASAHEHFSKMGKAIENTVSHYNKLVGAVDGRDSVFSKARRLRDLKIGKEDLPEFKLVEAAPRILTSEDWSPAERIAD